MDLGLLLMVRHMVMHIYNKSVENMIREYRSNCDLLIMICHAGMEGWNIPLPEWRDLYKHFIDIGTDIVIAHHPHVAQGWENYNGGHIFYSLGNFAFNKGNKILNNRGLGVIIEYDENKNLTYKVIPTKFENKQVLLNDDIDYKTELNKDCLILEDIDSYMQAINEKCIQAYNSIYKKAYFRVACKYKGGLMERIKGIVKSIFIQDGFQDIWLYHNLVIETHYYVCKRAVALSLKKKKII